MNLVETKPAPTSPFPLRSVLTAAGIAVGAVCIIGVLAAFASLLGKMKKVAAAQPPAVASGQNFSDKIAVAPPAGRENIVGTWRADWRANGQAYSVVITFSPMPAYGYTRAYTAGGIAMPLQHGEYSYLNGELLINYRNGGWSRESITWLDDNRFIAKVIADSDLSRVNAQCTFTRGS